MNIFKICKKQYEKAKITMENGKDIIMQFIDKETE